MSQPESPLPSDVVSGPQTTSEPLVEDSRGDATVPVVAIGASAGGLTALETFFEQLPTDTGAAFVIIQHLSPEHESHMQELLGRRTTMRTQQMREDMPLSANQVYVMPPGHHVELEGAQLRLVSRIDGSEGNQPIDRFFDSLARNAKPPMAAVVLSGTGNDGSHGVRSVAAAGGLVLVQDEDTAQFNGMPLNAIKTDVVHVVCPVAELAEWIARYLDGATIEEIITESSPGLTRGDIVSLYELLQNHTGIEFKRYKQNTFDRRLARRIMLRGCESLTDYAELLRQDPQEISRLSDDLLIGVTKFFRDPAGFQRFASRVIRPLVRTGKGSDEIRVWVAGCATGQEAYSVAMLLHDEMEHIGSTNPLRIFATDVHPDAIRFAQQGRYPREALDEIPAKIRQKYVRKSSDSFQIKKEIRDSIVFAHHDILQDAPFTRLHLVTCRNLLIYLDDAAQRQVVSAFANALRTRGVMWLGPSETPGDVSEAFVALDKPWRIFQKEREMRLPIDLKLRQRVVPRTFSNRALPISRSPAPAVVLSYDRLLERYAPPSLLLNEELRPLQVFGNLTPILAQPSGRLTGTVDDILCEPLRLPVESMLRRMRSQESEHEQQWIELEGTVYRLSVEAFHHAALNETHYLLSFDPANPAGPPTSESANSRPPTATPTATAALPPIRLGGHPSDASANEERIRMLEMELDFSRESLQATIEELETTNEELQSSNEELTSSNEELQSTNEELHSVNQELQATNAESERSVQMLAALSADLESVLEQSRLALILLDKRGTIRRLTRVAAELLGGDMEAIIGEPIFRYAAAIPHFDFTAAMEQIEQTGALLEREVSGTDGVPLLIALVPYQNQGGFVLTVTNLRSVRETATQLRKLNAIVSKSTDAIIGIDLDGQVTSWNYGAAQLFGREIDPAGQPNIRQLLPGTLPDLTFDMLERLQSRKTADWKEARVQIDGVSRVLQARVTPVLREGERAVAAALTIYDVTELRRTEEELELRTRAIDAASNGIIIVDAKDPELPIIYSNRGFTKVTGFGAKEIIGRNCRFLQGPDTDQEKVAQVKRAIDNQTDCRVTLLNYRRNGEPFYNDLIIAPVKNHAGEVTHFVGIQHDVTETFRAHEELQRGELEYRSTFETAAVGIAHVGLDGRWLRVNQKLCDIVGYAREELLGKTFQDLTHEEDLNKDLREFMRLIRGEIQGYAMEKRYLHREGQTVWVHLTTSLRRDPHGKPECCIAIIQDISQRRETERRLLESKAIISEVLESIGDPFFSIDRAGCVQAASQTAAELCGQVRGDMIGKPMDNLTPFAGNSPLASLVQRVRDSRRAEATEFLAPNCNRWYDVRCFPIEDGAALYMNDVTTRKETEMHLEQARVAAEQASRAKTQFLTNMSHEIRSPMSAILGFSDIALRDLREGRAANPEHVETVIRNGRFLLRIINDILDLSKVEAGKLHVRKSPFRTVAMLADILELMRHRSRESGIPLSVQFTSAIPDRLHSDRSRVEQILVNLIGNAIKFTPEGEVRVMVSANPSEGLIVFRVVDTGIGISQDNLKRLFEAFCQVHDQRIQTLEGTGLGLAISKRLANLLGGNIGVQSVEGEGSTFTLTLPIGSVSKPRFIEPQEQDLQPRQADTGSLARVRGRILVADDAGDVRFVTKHFLARAGAVVDEVTNGAEAVVAVREAEASGHPYDCILMDMQMPELDGRQATQTIRDSGYTVPVIALTAGATQQEMQEAMNAGCTQFYSKPVDGPELVKRIAKLLHETYPARWRVSETAE